MYGFSITVNGSFKTHNPSDISYQNITCESFMINKFNKDKLFTETEEYIVILDGVITNKEEIISTNSIDDVKDWKDSILNLYKTEGDQFFSKFRGSFAGALFDKIKQRWIIFGDQIGSRFIFYAKIGDYFCCTESMGYIYDMLKRDNIDYHLDNIGSKLLMTYGYMIDNYTLCEEVKKIIPGCYITIQNSKLEEHRYYFLDNTPDETISEQEAIERIDYFFRQAVIRDFNKDNEYGYKHLVALSGGLDARMTSFVAHDCGYTDQLNMTFSQSNYWDQKIPMQMASDLCHEWIYKSLDNGLWLFDIDDITRWTGGNVVYYGLAHGNSLLKYLNFSELGVLHSGQIGDVIIGSFITSDEKNEKYDLGVKAYSTKFIDCLKGVNLLIDANKEIGSIYYRAFNGANNGLQYIYNYTETLSPFLDLDMMENILKIPVELRQRHYIYKKWILSKYRQAGNYVWETTGQKITAKTIRLQGRDIPIANIPYGVFKRVKRIFGYSISDSKENMNPLAFYMKHNSSLEAYLLGYYKYIDAVDKEDIRGILLSIKEDGTALEKLQAVSLLSAMKMFYK